MAGRPTKYEEKYNEQAYKLCLLGATDKDLADFFEVEEQTINNWKHDFPQFFESIKEGKTIADMHLAEKLKNKAEGAVINTQQAFKVKETVYEQGQRIEREKIVVVDLKQEQPPDTTALIFWLKNRAGKYWRDKQEIDHTTGGEKISFTPINFVNEGNKDS